MKRIITIISSVLLALIATAQEIPDAARREGVTLEELPRWRALQQVPRPPAPSGRPTPYVTIDWSTVTIPQPDDSCPNRGFESNNWNSWHALTGTRIGASAPLLQLGASPHTCTNLSQTSRHCILPGPSWWVPPSDPLITLSPKIFVPFPNAGSRTARLGNPRTGGEGEAIYQVFTITPATAELIYRYALVLQDPLHEATAQPFFGAYVYDVGSGNPVPPLLTFRQRVSSGTDPFFHNNNLGTLWREVSCERIDLTPWIGRRVMVVYASADCAYGGHYGYGYLDGKCGAADPPTLTIRKSFCVNDTVTATGSTVDPATSHTWTVVETDASGANPVAATLATETFNGPIPSPSRDLTAWYGSKGQQFRCGRHYRVTLAATTECQTNVSVSEVISISCPPTPVIAGPIDTCTRPGTYCVQPQRGTTYSWSVTGGTPATGSGSCINVTWSSTGPYFITVTATNLAGCKTTTRIPIQPCRCCLDTRLTTPPRPGLTSAGQGLINFSAPLTLTGFSPVTSVTATLVSANTTTSSTACGPGGPIVATVAGGSVVNPWGGPLLSSIPSNEISWSGNGPVNGVIFPFQIQLPPPPTPPCSEIVRFCVKWTFTGPAGPGTHGCRTCSFTRCYAFRRSGERISWLDDLPAMEEPPVLD